MPSIFISPHTKIAYLFLGSTIVILAGVIFGLFNVSIGIEIIITPEPEEVDINFEVQINEEVITEDSKILSGRILETVQEAQEKNMAQATVSMKDYAEGEVILTNNTRQYINFVASTRFGSPEGLIFRAVDRIRIPPNGQTTVLVRADKMGGEYDIGPTKFTIPNLRDPNLKKNILVENKEPMTGGIKKTGIVMQADLDKAVNELKEKLYTTGLAEIERELPESDLKIIIKSDILEEKTDAQAGEEKAEFITLVKLKIGAVAFKEKDLLEIALEFLNEKIPSGKKLAAFEPDSLSYRLISYNPEKKLAALEVQFRGYMIIKADHQILEKTHFRNLTAKEIKNYLAEFKEIRQVKIKLWPPLILKKVPQDIDKIEVVIKQL